MPRISLLTVILAACDPGSGDAAPADGKAAAKAPPAPEAKEAGANEEKAPETLPPAPEGTVEIDGRYVHTCAEPTSCPTLMHAEGAAHCAGLTLGDLKWRLPTVDELESWRGNGALSGYDVFHWSGSAWEEDASQVWIYDPGSGAKTTAKPTRKPFTIRCVADPS